MTRGHILGDTAMPKLLVMNPTCECCGSLTDSDPNFGAYCECCDIWWPNEEANEVGETNLTHTCIAPYPGQVSPSAGYEIGLCALPGGHRGSHWHEISIKDTKEK